MLYSVHSTLIFMYYTGIYMCLGQSELWLISTGTPVCGKKTEQLREEIVIFFTIHIQLYVLCYAYHHGIKIPVPFYSENILVCV